MDRAAAARFENLKLFGVALILRAIYLGEIHGSPLLTLVGDGKGYDAWARRIQGGDWLGSEVFYQAPLYPYFLATVYATLGHDPLMVRILQAALGAFACVLLARAGEAFLSRRVGLAAGWGLALYPFAIFYGGLIQKTSLALFLTTLLLFLLGRAQSTLRPARFLAAGCCLGALALLRENALALLVIVVPWSLWLRGGGSARRAARGAAFLAGVALVLLPVAARNFALGGAFLPTTSQLGPNLYIGNQPGGDGTYRPLLPGRGSSAFERSDAHLLAESALGRRLTPAEVSSYWTDRTRQAVVAEPGRWVLLMLRKCLLVLNAAELPDTSAYQAYCDESVLLSGLVRCFNLGVILPLCGLGLWLTRRRWRSLCILHLVGVTMGASVAAFYVLGRYRFSILPVCLLFAAAGAVGLPRALRAALATGNRGRPIGWVCLLIGGALLANLPLVTPSDPRGMTYATLGGTLIGEGRPEAAIPVCRRALALDPGLPGAHLNLGVALLQTNHPEDALVHLRRAVELDPQLGAAHLHRSSALATLGRRAEAIQALQDARPHLGRQLTGALEVGRRLLGLGQRQEALEVFADAAQRWPTSPRAHNAFGVALASADRIEEAVASFRTALELDPNDTSARANLQRALTEERTER